MTLRLKCNSALIVCVTHMLGSAFERGYGVLPNSVVPEKHIRTQCVARCRFANVLLAHTVRLTFFIYFFPDKALYPVQVKVYSGDSLGCVCAASSSVTHIQSTSFLPVLGEGGAHVTMQTLDRPHHQVIH